MKKLIYFTFAVLIGLTSANLFAQTTGTANQETKPASQDEEGGDEERDGGDREARRGPALTPVALKEGAAKLAPENTKVDFVGTHEGDEPKPRLGGFKKFTGSLAMTDDGTSIKSLTMEFEIGSIWTEAGDDLTKHLLNADFFDVEKYPKAKFVSKTISAGKTEGSFKVVGDFTLMEKTNEITLPVTIKTSDKGVVAKSNFKLDRTTFGMSNMVDRICKEVAVSLIVGMKTTGGAPPAADQGAGRGGRGRGGRGPRDPEAFFKAQDKNGDGKIAGDEIGEQMKSRISDIDSDGDEAVSLEEWKAAVKKFRERRGSGQRGGDDEAQRGGNRGGDDK